jgi:hypothetical protein
MQRVFEHTSHAPAAAWPRRPRASANPYIATPFVTWTTTHLTLVKPRNRQHDVYPDVLRFIRKALASAAAPGATGPHFLSFILRRRLDAVGAERIAQCR